MLLHFVLQYFKRGKDLKMLPLDLEGQKRKKNILLNKEKYPKSQKILAHL